MQMFEVDDELVELVWRLANPKPFESLTFNSALRRILIGPKALDKNPEDHEKSLDDWIAELVANAPAGARKAPSPSASQWVAAVPELSKKKHLTSWKAICIELKIDPAGDSARRKLKNWVATNRPNWPDVPEPNSVSA